MTTAIQNNLKAFCIMLYIVNIGWMLSLFVIRNPDLTLFFLWLALLGELLQRLALVHYENSTL